ncbi:hypothetical protein [Sinomonas mesophila]|uniref:hypothetical protein n=1 Tax=Sinomonas mesophila TaxID=1531955 RepID=UPI000984CF42|nr:hypothetical protein [Sinomonas mesophila]
MQDGDRAIPPPGLPALDDQAPLDKGYTQEEHYGHNQDFTVLRDPKRYADAPPGEPRHEVDPPADGKKKRRRGHAFGLGTSGAGGIPDSTGHAHTGFGDPDRD